MKLRASASAEHDLAEIRRYIAVDSPRAAERVISRIRAAAVNLIVSPDMGRTGKADGTREWVVRGLPYIIVYQVDWSRDEIVLVNVFHGAQHR